jgi:hypothetical protein
LAFNVARVVELADTPDLGFDSWPFLAISSACLNRFTTIMVIERKWFFSQKQKPFEKTLQVAQKVAQIHFSKKFVGVCIIGFGRLRNSGLKIGKIILSGHFFRLLAIRV